MDSYVGEIRLLPYTYPPQDWAFCDGSSLPVQQCQALYVVIGNQFGGNYQNFNLPNLIGKCVVGAGTGPGLTTRTQATTGGTQTVTLITTEMPQHSHAFQANSGAGDQEMPSADLIPSGIAAGRSGLAKYAPGTPTVAFGAPLGAAGGNAAHENMQPYVTMNFCISLYGEFPNFS